MVSFSQILGSQEEQHANYSCEGRDQGATLVTCLT